MGLLRARVARLLLALTFVAMVVAPAEPVFAAASGNAATPLASSLHPADGFTVGSQVVVHADGDGLRLRDTPALSGNVLATLADGIQLAVLDGRVSADGYWWQHVQAGAQSGWVAEMYLRPAAPSSTLVQTSGGCPAAAPPAQQPVVQTSPPPAPPAPAAGSLSGSVPHSGFGLAVWSGGSVDVLASSAAGSGCRLSAAWVTNGNGDFTGYVYGAPDVVNDAWRAQFPGDLPGGTPLILICGGPSGVALTTASLTAGPALPALMPLAPATNLVPAPWAPAPVAVHAIPPPATAAYEALVFDGSSGAPMYEKNDHQPVPPASLTKIATAILTIQAGNLDSWVTVDVDSQQMPGSSVMGLRPGDCFRVRDLLYGLLLPSGNDAAIALARYEAGSEAAFVAQMNALLVKLDLHDSHFMNPHGLDEPGHVASAYDLAVLARYAMTLPDFTAIVGTRQWTAQGSRTIPLTNVNTFLNSYPGADGVKTGFTDSAGRTLVASVTRNGRRVFVVVMNTANRDGDAATLFDWAFANFVWG